MSNFDIFNKEYLLKINEPFVKDMTNHITPIKYEAITPDIFALLFRTMDNNHEDQYYVSLEFDYIDSLQEANKIIQNWHNGKVIEFLNPENSAGNSEPRVK